MRKMVSDTWYQITHNIIQNSKKNFKFQTADICDADHLADVDGLDGGKTAQKIES